MARWQLMEACYLFGYPPDLEESGVEWEYKELDATTGRERRKRFKVPFHFPEGTFVCRAGRGLPTDFVIEGPASHAMRPLDAEAEAENAKIPKPMNLDMFLPEQGLSASILQGFENQVAKLATLSAAVPIPVAQSGVPKEEFELLQRQVAELMAQNAELKASIKPTGTLNRRF